MMRDSPRFTTLPRDVVQPGHWDMQQAFSDSYMDIGALHPRSEIRRLLFVISRVTASRCRKLNPEPIWLNCFISPYTTTHLGPHSYMGLEVISLCSGLLQKSLIIFLEGCSIPAPHIHTCSHLYDLRCMNLQPEVVHAVDHKS